MGSKPVLQKYITLNYAHFSFHVKSSLRLFLKRHILEKLVISLFSQRIIDMYLEQAPYSTGLEKAFIQM